MGGVEGRGGEKRQTTVLEQQKINKIKVEKKQNFKKILEKVQLAIVALRFPKQKSLVNIFEN